MNNIKKIDFIFLVISTFLLGLIYGSFFKNIIDLFKKDYIKRKKYLNGKYIFFCYPHTSYLDGLLSISTSFLYVQSHNFSPLFPIAQHHSVPNFIKKYTYPIGTKNNQTKDLIKLINNLENCNLYIAPEGTRKRTEKIKKGFYFIAKDTNLPIVCVTTNFSKFETFYSNPISVKNKSIDEVMEEIKKWYKNHDMNEVSIDINKISPLKI